MAGIDKIYGNREQWVELWGWLVIHRSQYSKFLYAPYFDNNVQIRPITNFPLYADIWLYDNCPLTWVKERIEEQYNGPPH